jgi:hypothetical protein
MKSLLTVIFICALAPSCVSSRSMEDVVGIKPGSSIKTLKHSTLTEEEVYTSTASIWSGGDRIKVCLNSQPPPTGSPSVVVGALPRGTTIYLDEIKHANLIDWQTYFFEAHSFRDSTRIDFIIYSHAAQTILGIQAAEQDASGNRR